MEHQPTIKDLSGKKVKIDIQAINQMEQRLSPLYVQFCKAHEDIVFTAKRYKNEKYSYTFEENDEWAYSGKFLVEIEEKS